MRRYDFQGKLDRGADFVAGLCRKPNKDLVWLGFNYTTSQYFERAN